MTIYCKTTIIHEVETLAGTTIQSFASYTFFKKWWYTRKKIVSNKSCFLSICIYKLLYLNYECFISYFDQKLYIRIRKDPPPPQKKSFFKVFLTYM